jgi:hypothetical protein
MKYDKYTTLVDSNPVSYGWKIRLLLLILMSLAGFQYSHACSWQICSAGCEAGDLPQYEKIVCDWCGGCGYFDDWVYCPSCADKPSDYDCFYCGNNRYIWGQDTCTACLGIGVWWGYVYYMCPSCDGAGGWDVPCYDNNCPYHYFLADSCLPRGTNAPFQNHGLRHARKPDMLFVELTEGYC